MGTCRRHGTPEPRSSRPYRFHVPTAIPVLQVYRPRSRGQTFLLSSGCGEGAADGINCRCAREVRMLRRTALAC